MSNCVRDSSYTTGWRLHDFLVYTTIIMPTVVLEPTIEAETSQLCNEYEGNAADSEILHLPCYQPTRGSVLVIHVPNVVHSFSLCAVEVYGMFCCCIEQHIIVCYYRKTHAIGNRYPRVLLYA